jgi:hypothetical protein
MNRPPGPDPGHDPDARWYQRRPTSDDRTAIARPRPTPPSTAPPPPPPNIPWYLQRPHRPPPSASEVKQQDPTEKQDDAAAAARTKLIPWLLVGAGGLAVLIGTAVLLSSIGKLGLTGGTVLDVTKVQTGVLQTLSDPASGYGANTVTDVSCNSGHNPSADKGATFTCDVVVNGTQRHVTVVVSDDHGTYEIDGPR